MLLSRKRASNTDDSRLEATPKPVNEFKKDKEEIPNFLIKLYQILESPENKDIIHWSENGKFFIIQSIHDFTENVWNKYYKHNNYSSFVRQLNMYDFHKKRSKQNEHIFQHKHFIKGEKDWIKTINRKNKNTPSININWADKVTAWSKSNNNNANTNMLIKNMSSDKNSQALIEYNNIETSSSKKVTKQGLEKTWNYLMQVLNTNTEKQNTLEVKVEKWSKQNEEVIVQNQKMLQEIWSKSEYNKKLEAVVCFILEMLFKKQTIQAGNQDIKNLLISQDLNDNIECNWESPTSQDIIPAKKMNILSSANETFKAFLDKYVEQSRLNTVNTNKNNNNSTNNNNNTNNNKYNDISISNIPSPKDKFNQISSITPIDNQFKMTFPMLASGENNSMYTSEIQSSPIRERIRKYSFEVNEDWFNSKEIWGNNNNNNNSVNNIMLDTSNLSIISNNIFDLEFEKTKQWN